MFLRVLILAAFITSAVTPMEAAEQSIDDTGRRSCLDTNADSPSEEEIKEKRSPSASPVRVKKENGVTVAKSEGREIAVAFTVRDRVVTNSGSERSGGTDLNGFPVTQPDARAAKISVAAEQRPRSSQRHVITRSNNEF